MDVLVIVRVSRMSATPNVSKSRDHQAELNGYPSVNLTILDLSLFDRRIGRLVHEETCVGSCTDFFNSLLDVGRFRRGLNLNGSRG